MKDSFVMKEANPSSHRKALSVRAGRRENAYVVPGPDNRILNRSSRYQFDAILHAAIVAAPVVAFTLVIFWFSRNPITPVPAVEASVNNPTGFLTSNFVYDGLINIENIVASSIFLLAVCIYFPWGFRVFLAYLLPLAAIGAGSLAEFTTMSTSLVHLPFCSGSCSFYGMSGMASGMIGFAVATFSIAVVALVLRMRGRMAVKEGDATFGRGMKGLVLLLSMFVAYLVSLLFFSGLIPLPTTVASGNQGPAGAPPGPPPAILTQAPPVALVHSASIVYGFLLCLVVFTQVNRHYHILNLRATD
jgi:hypothetical protein